MDEDKKALRGSETRDAFKHAHKNVLPRDFYGSDLDFAIIGKNEEVVAFYDFKTLVEPKITRKDNWAEICLYSSLLKIAPVFVMRSDYPIMGPYYVSRFIPEEPYETLPAKLPTTSDWENWERKLRNGIER